MGAQVRCEEVHAALSGLAICEETASGARLATHCLYPSFESVRVFVAKFGDGYKVHDDGGAYREAWLHGRDDALISRIIRTEALRSRLKISDTSIIADVPSADWLLSAILTVSNASATAARKAVEKLSSATESALVDKVGDVLLSNFAKSRIKVGYDVRGLSGGSRHFDFGISGPHGREIVVNCVLPHPGSVSSKYVSFADTELEETHKLAVFDRPLETADVALLQQVASIVPFAVLPRTATRLLPDAR